MPPYHILAAWLLCVLAVNSHPAVSVALTVPEILGVPMARKRV
jgi:hypothetical protein